MTLRTFKELVLSHIVIQRMEFPVTGANCHWSVTLGGCCGLLCWVECWNKVLILFAVQRFSAVLGLNLLACGIFSRTDKCPLGEYFIFPLLQIAILMSGTPAFSFFFLIPPFPASEFLFFKFLGLQGSYAEESLPLIHFFFLP